MAVVLFKLCFSFFTLFSLKSSRYKTLPRLRAWPYGLWFFGSSGAITTAVVGTQIEITVEIKIEGMCAAQRVTAHVNPLGPDAPGPLSSFPQYLFCLLQLWFYFVAVFAESLWVGTSHPTKSPPLCPAKGENTGKPNGNLPMQESPATGPQLSQNIQKEEEEAG